MEYEQLNTVLIAAWMEAIRIRPVSLCLEVSLYTSLVRLFPEFLVFALHISTIQLEDLIHFFDAKIKMSGDVATKRDVGHFGGQVGEDSKLYDKYQQG